MRRLLVLGAGFYHRRIYESLRKGGYYLIGIDRDPKAPARELAHEFYPIDIADEEAVIAVAGKANADAVIPLNEFGMRAHAAAVEKLGLLGNSRLSSELAVDKEKMRRQWHEDGLPQPVFAAFGSGDSQETDITEAMMASELVGFPCVIKPTDSGGSGRGIMILRSCSEIAEGVAFARPHARNGRMLLEGFVEGTEMTVEGLVVDGVHTILAASDKEKPPLRTRVATSLNYPAKFNGQILQAVHDIVDRAVASLGLTHSATHTEVIVTPGGEVVLVEMGARGGGGHVFADIVNLVSGIDMPCALAAILCGDKPKIEPLRQTGACYRFFNPPPGVLRKVSGIRRAAINPNVVDVGMFKKAGDKVGNLYNSIERAGYLITKGPDRDSAWATANQIESEIELVVEPMTTNIVN